jgi:hypothetical protein
LTLGPNLFQKQNKKPDSFGLLIVFNVVQKK